MRRVTHEGFNARGSEQYQPMHIHETRLTVLDIIAHPDEWNASLKQYVILVFQRSSASNDRLGSGENLG